MTKQKTPRQTTDTRGTVASRSDAGKRDNARVDAPRKQAAAERQHAGAAGKDGYRDTKGTNPPTAGQIAGHRGLGDDVDGDGLPRAGQQRFESPIDNRDQSVAPGRDIEFSGQRRAAGRTDDDDSPGNQRRASNGDDEFDQRLVAGNDDDTGSSRRAASEGDAGDRTNRNPNDRDNRRASSRDGDKRGSKQR